MNHIKLFEDNSKLNTYEFEFLSYLGKIEAKSMEEALCLVIMEHKGYIDQDFEKVTIRCKKKKNKNKK